MSFVSQQYWVPQLRQLTKTVIRGCYGCKKFHITAFSNPKAGKLPTDRTDESAPFQVKSWPGLCRTYRVQTQDKKTGKAYSLLLAFSLTRAVQLELLPNQTAEKFIKHLRWFIMRKGYPRKIYLNNGQNFVASVKWLNRVVKHEKLQNYLAHQEIRLQFYLSRAPWWGWTIWEAYGYLKTAIVHSIC